MILKNGEKLDNSNGLFNKLNISTIPELDLITNVITVSLYYHNSRTDKDITVEQFSTKRIFETNSKFKTFFYLDLEKHNYSKIECEINPINQEIKNIEFNLNVF